MYTICFQYNYNPLFNLQADSEVHINILKICHISGAAKNEFLVLENRKHFIILYFSYQDY